MVFSRFDAFIFQLDGLLFYHKKAHYTFGASPLVVWLKAYMMPEILGIGIPDELTQLAPSSYTGFSSHAEEVRQRKERRAATALESMESAVTSENAAAIT